MSVASFEGIVENGRIRLDPAVRLPENTRVYVLVPNLPAVPRARMISPRLLHPEQATEFTMEVVQPDAGV